MSVTDHRRADRLWRIVAGRSRERTFSGWVGVACQVALEQVDVDGAAIVVRSAGRAQELVAATGPWVRELEELQYTVGEGPAVEAFANGAPVLVSDMAAAAGRWPGFAEADADVGAVFAFPLQEGTIRLGTLGLYRRAPGALSDDEFADAAVLADLSTTALLTDVGGENIEGAPWMREGAPGHYDDVNVATGMLAAELRISIEDAFLRLRAHAFTAGEPLLEVARAVLARRLGADAFGD
jgi:hypothetical protein